MHILVTNDDGVLAPGLFTLVRELRLIGEVTVCAPDRSWSASGHVKTLHRPLRVHEVILSDGTPAYASDGAPSDCVALSLMGFIEQKIDLVVAGINPNANIGYDVTYSGTVTAAMEAVITGGVPGIAVSLDAPEHYSGALDFNPAARIARQVVERAVERGIPQGVLLNVNVPHLPEEQIKGCMLTRQGLRLYRDVLEKRLDPRGRPYYWIGGEAPSGVDEPGTDFGALRAGYVSITPLQLDLTARDALAVMEDWEWCA